jgi:riboflavin-specific deaminase-like protein
LGCSIYENIQLPDDTRERPYVILNMVHSIDGRAAIEGKASRLGTDTDRNVMRTLRSRADAVMVGGGTIRAEKLSLSLDAEDTRSVPRAVILTNTGDVPLESNLVRDRRQDVLVLLPGTAGKDVERSLAPFAEIRRVPATAYGRIDVSRALEIMKSDYGIDILLCEGGTTLNQALISANLVDELFITKAPVLVGTIKETIAFPEDKPGDPRSLCLISSHQAGDEIFLRYSIQKGIAAKL